MKIGTLYDLKRDSGEDWPDGKGLCGVVLEGDNAGYVFEYLFVKFDGNSSRQVCYLCKSLKRVKSSRR